MTPCNGCPQIPNKPPDAAGEVYIIYTGGREHADLSKLDRAMPPSDGQRRTFPRPIFHEDGSIEYEKRRGDWEPPRPIDGCEPDPKNPWLFRPRWEYCVHRIAGPQGSSKTAWRPTGHDHREHERLRWIRL